MEQVSVGRAGGCSDHPGGDCGCPLLDRPPATDAFEPTDPQRAFVTTRDRRCRFPQCGQRVGWADLDHVTAHADGADLLREPLLSVPFTPQAEDLRPGWRFVMDDDGTVHVTTPSGVTRTTRPPGRIEQAVTTAAALFIPEVFIPEVIPGPPENPPPF